MCLQRGLYHVQSGAEAWEQQSLENNPPWQDWHTCITLHPLNTVTFCECPTCIFNVGALEHTLLYPCAALQQLFSLVGFPCWGTHINKWWWWREFYNRSSPVCTVAVLGEQVNLSGFICMMCSMQGSAWAPCTQQAPSCTNVGPSISQSTLPHKQACWHAPSACPTAWKKLLYPKNIPQSTWVVHLTSRVHLQPAAPALADCTCSTIHVYSLKTGIWVGIGAWSARNSWNRHWGRDGRSRASWGQILH